MKTIQETIQETIDIIENYISTTYKPIYKAVFALGYQRAKLKYINLDNKKRTTIMYVKRHVEKFYNIKDIGEHTRKREIVKARQVAMYICLELKLGSLATIGSIIGNKAHATVLYSKKTVANEITINKIYSRELDLLISSL